MRIRRGRMDRRRFLTALTTAAAGMAAPSSAAPVRPARIPDNVRQLIVATAASWNANRGLLQWYSRSSARAEWVPALAKPIPVLFGRAGLAWGNGALPVPHGEPGVPSKREKDLRAPAGVFRIGKLYGYAPGPPQGCRLPYHQVTERDCWIDDVNHPAYNRHILVDPANPPPWYSSQRMRLGDFAYEFLLEIRHNADPPIRGHGSAIFFHIRRGPDRPSHGCTTMERGNLVSMLRWLDPRAHPHYVCLPAPVYGTYRKSWGLPPPP